MIEYFTVTPRGVLEKLDEEQEGCWIAAFAPTPMEVADLAERYGLAKEDVRAALDLDEVSRIEAEEGYDLAILDTPIRDRSAHEFGYKTIPIAVFDTGENVITVCSEPRIPLVKELRSSRRLPSTRETGLFAVRLMIASSAAYLSALRVINRARVSLMAEKNRPSRKELEDMYALDESLVYFKSSLTTNDYVLEKRLRASRHFDADVREAFEDVVQENRQALETTRTFSQMLDSAIDHFGLLMDHDLNRTMQVMTVVTLVMCIPTAVAGFFGMNVPGIPMEDSPIGFGVVVTLTCAGTAMILLALRRARWF